MSALVERVTSILRRLDRTFFGPPSKKGQLPTDVRDSFERVDRRITLLHDLTKTMQNGSREQ